MSKLFQDQFSFTLLILNKYFGKLSAASGTLLNGLTASSLKSSERLQSFWLKRGWNTNAQHNEVKTFVLPAQQHLFITFDRHPFLFLLLLFQDREGKKAVGGWGGVELTEGGARGWGGKERLRKLKSF